MKKLKSIILSIRKIFKKKAKVRTMKPYYSKEVNRKLTTWELEAAILDECELKISD